MRRIGYLLCALLLTLAGCQAVAPPAPAPAERQMRLGDGVMRYSEQGRGVPVVFVHGSMSDGRIWDVYRERVAARYRYVAIDQRYFGGEPWTDRGERFMQPTHAADLAAFIQGLQAGPVHVVAWSYGGSVATLAASRHPELFRSLTLHEPTIGSLIAGTPEGKAAVAAFEPTSGACGRWRMPATRPRRRGSSGSSCCACRPAVSMASRPTCGASSSTTSAPCR